jgi:hypothetical protein
LLILDAVAVAFELLEGRMLSVLVFEFFAVAVIATI